MSSDGVNSNNNNLIYSKLAANRCICMCLISQHRLNTETGRMPCNNPNCSQGGRCGNFGHGAVHTREQLIECGLEVIV